MDSTTVGVIVILGTGLALATWDSLRVRRRLQRHLAAPRAPFDHRGMLSEVVAFAPMAILLLRSSGTIVLANPAARQLLFDGNDPTGDNLLGLLHQAPQPLRDALLADEDALFTVGDEGEAETYHLAKRSLREGAEMLTLVVVRHLTRELRRQEVAVWKKLLRVISHELNNSLAPISSLAHTGRKLAQDPAKVHFLDELLTTIEERAMHLKSFLAGYASLARLPDPLPGVVPWPPLLAHLKEAFPALQVGPPPADAGWFDRAQVEQLLLNLVKNAQEASAEPADISLDVRRVDTGHELIVRDRGTGMSPEVLQSALLPFYSTKARGTGLGLALCREIVEAHRGKIRLSNREHGGLEVVCFFPDRAAPPPTPAKLTITRV